MRPAERVKIIEWISSITAVGLLALLVNAVLG
ncbi:hypothetical protein Sinme_5286 [Sinorhizobium meliloti AK83]|nr:hypothetical protein Sinme_5286 [Sinorhizobium meliloti AK83]CCM70122.1 putative membrane protein [Sinorhizobium meliloti Rm41]